MKIPKWINDRLPISRGRYKKDMTAIMVVINALKESEAQTSQVQMNILKTLGSLTPKKKAANGKNGKQDTMFQ